MTGPEIGGITGVEMSASNCTVPVTLIVGRKLVELTGSTCRRLSCSAGTVIARTELVSPAPGDSAADAAVAPTADVSDGSDLEHAPNEMAIVEPASQAARRPAPAAPRVSVVPRREDPAVELPRIGASTND